MRIVCSSCQRANALKDGPKTPTGKAICQSCKDKIEARISRKTRKSSNAATYKLKKNSDLYADGVLKSCAKGD